MTDAAEAAFPPALLARVEDAGLDASAPPQQRWLDGWLVRLLPGKARRARCINALGPGALSLDERLAEAERLYAAAGLPLLFRISRFTQPATLDDALADRGFEAVDPTLVMVCTQLPTRPTTALPAGLHLGPLNAEAYAEAVGALRGSPPEHRRSHALRLRQSPVPYQGWALHEGGPAGPVMACGQVAADGRLAGLYDVFTHPDARGRGLAGYLCEHLLSQAAALGADIGYLQVDAANAAALAVYHRLGFRAGYRYHYRERPGAAG